TIVFAVNAASSPKASPGCAGAVSVMLGTDGLGGLDFVCPNAGAAIGKATIAATKPARSNAKPIAFSLTSSAGSPVVSDPRLVVRLPLSRLGKAALPKFPPLLGVD